MLADPLRARLLPLVAERRPAHPLDIILVEPPADAARRFSAVLPWRVLYAVKCNPQQAVIAALGEAGIGHFDVASLAEAALVRHVLPQAGLHYMHPVKPRDSITEAYRRFGITTFAVDDGTELDKIIAATDGARDLTVLLRLALPKGGAGRDQSGKFGISADAAPQVLRRMTALGGRVGVTFHVGSQCTDPQAFAEATALAMQVARAAGVEIDILDVGGGFPASYDDCTPPPLGEFAAAITSAGPLPELWCEPGRALAACAQATVARVIGRKGDAVFLNDGIYGGLDPAPLTGYRYPVWAVAADGRDLSAAMIPFDVFGPTCDSHDRLPVPYALPADITEGDWIVFENTGAYASALATDFNGMGLRDGVVVV